MSSGGRVLAFLLVALAALPAPGSAARSVRPRAFASCAALVRYGERNLAVTHGVPARPVVGIGAPVDAGRPAPAPEGSSPAQPVSAAPTSDGAGTTFSTTNNQEEGVDEPDIVKTDGSTIFAVAQGRLVALAVGGDAPRVVGTLALPGDAFNAQLLLRGRRLIVISPGAVEPVPLGRPGGPQPAIAPLPSATSTIVTEVDVRDPAAMTVARTLTIDGAFVDARQNGSTARVVISSTPRAVIEPATRVAARGWVPARRFRSALTGRHYVRPAASCATIRHPVRFSGLGMLTILTIDLDRGLWAADSDALMADAQVVYGSTTSLYVATQRWIDPQTAPERVPTAQATVINRFDVTDPARTTLAASGEVPGYLLNQFSLSDYGGDLRVATTSRPIWWGGGPPPGESESAVTVLDQRGRALVPVGRVGGLGKGQQIYSVRFIADMGYVVTFKQVDPLYTIDLSSPTAPRVAGQLEIEGFSSYLHPVGKGLLLGIGQSGGNGGMQVELFDVSDPAAPKLLQHTALGGGSYSEAQYDHHAFLFWPATKLAMLPVQLTTRDGSSSFVGAIGYNVDRDGIPEVGRVSHDPIQGGVPPVRRAIVIGDRLFTISDTGAVASDLQTLARRASVAFPNASGG